VAVAGGQVDLSPLGLAVTRPAAEVAALTRGIAAVRSQPLPPAGRRLVLRTDLHTTGLLTTLHVDSLQRFAAAPADGGSLRTDGISELLAAAAAQPSSAGFLVSREAAGGALRVGALDVTNRGEIVLRTAATEPSEVLGRIEGRVSDPRGVLRGLPVGTLRPGERPVVVRPGPVAGTTVVDTTRPGPVGGPLTGPTGTIPPLVRDAAVISRFETAVSELTEISAVADARPVASVVAFPLGRAANALEQRCAPANAHVVRVGTMVHFGGKPLSQFVAGTLIGGITVSPFLDRIMAYPELPDPAYRMLARYDRDRLLPGVDAIPPDSVTLLETNPRFVGGFLAGLNYELNRELLWRRYPTDQKGTPMRRFWDRGGEVDIPAMHTWRPLTTTLVNEAGGVSNLVLLVRGELLRRYPNTVVLAIAASAPDTPSTRDEDVKHPIFSGYLDPDISFFGFDLVDDDLTRGSGWFFALQEQVTEPRFALDETVDTTRGGGPTAWRAVAWPDTPVASSTTFTVDNLRTVATANHLAPSPTNGANVAEALFQNPVQVLVHARHLVAEQP
jgi:hypothetical protein